MTVAPTQPSPPDDAAEAGPRPVRSWWRLALAGVVGIACVWGLVVFGKPMGSPAPVKPGGPMDVAAPAAAGGGLERTDAELGAILHKQKGCNSCHSVDGSRNVGPSLAGIFGVQRLMNDGRSVLADEAYFRRATYEPAVEINAGYANHMPPYKGKVDDREMDALIAYYKSLPDPAVGAAGGTGAAPAK
jgi:cytochrome c553